MRPVLLLTALAFALAGCGGTTGEDAASPSESGDKRSAELARTFAGGG